METNFILEVIKAEHVGGYTLKILFNNGMARLYDFSKEFSKGVCSKLKDIDYFLNFKLDPFSIDWNNEIGFAPEYLLENGRPVNS